MVSFLKYPTQASLTQPGCCQRSKHGKCKVDNKYFAGKNLINILAHDYQKQALLQKGIVTEKISWVKDIDQLIAAPADCYMDLCFIPSANRVERLTRLLPKPVIIHSVAETLQSLQSPFIRMNAWPGFLQRKVIEYAAGAPLGREMLSDLSAALQCRFIFLPDEPGFIAGRVLAMIINEAYFALGEGVSSKVEIDIAMKAGTRYPLGPFEWGAKIGLPEILKLLDTLAEMDTRYRPAPMLREEACLPINKANS